MTQHADELNLLTAEEVIAQLRISRSTLDRLMSTGQIRAQKIGEGLRFHRADVVGALRERPSREQLTKSGAKGFLKLT